MSSIKISVTSDNQIRIDPVGDIDQDDWSSVVNWWTNSAPYPLPSTIIISPANFAYRKQWLRENWTNLDHSVEVGKGVLELVKSADNLVKDFDTLSVQENRGSDISIDHLNLRRPLTPFQIKNLQALVTMPNGANFSVPGAGKTSTTLAVWEYFRKLNKLTQLLVICPRSAFEAWKEEPSSVLPLPTVVNRFSDSPIPSDTEILYVNYEQLENTTRLGRLIKWISQSPTMLVIDEAHRIKGGVSSVRWRACLELSCKAERVDLLTGTPMPQSQEDLKNLLALSWRGVPRYFFSDERLTKLRRGGIFVRTTKEELALPPMRIETIELPMSHVQNEIYTALKRSFIGKFGMSEGDQGYFSKRGKAVMSLIAAATNPGLLMSSTHEDAYLGLQWPPVELSGSERLLHVLENYSLHEIPAKYEWVSRFVAKAAKEGRKVLVWSTFVGNLLALQRILKPYEPALVYGVNSIEEREAEITRFRVSEKCSVLLSNPQTLGEGVSLHKDCHDAIYIDRSYNAGLYLQSLDRIHRLGLKEDQTTNIYILESEASIDRNIARRLALKIDRLGTYLNDDRLAEVSLPSDDDLAPSDGMLGLDEFDLNDLYEHLREENGTK
jgi:SNF2 family DNA or RNA helicase